MKIDKRALLVGTIGGLVFSNALAWTYYQPVRAALQRSYGLHWTNDLLVLCGILGGLVMPGLVSTLARSRAFLWGLLPLTLFWISIDLEQGCEMGWASVWQTLPETIAVLGGCLLVSSGPVTFIRIILDGRKQAAEENARWEQRHAACLSSEEVWPPPPDDAA